MSFNNEIEIKFDYEKNETEIVGYGYLLFKTIFTQDELHTGKFKLNNNSYNGKRFNFDDTKTRMCEKYQIKSDQWTKILGKLNQKLASNMK